MCLCASVKNKNLMCFCASVLLSRIKTLCASVLLSRKRTYVLLSKEKSMCFCLRGED